MIKKGLLYKNKKEFILNKRVEEKYIQNETKLAYGIFDNQKKYKKVKIEYLTELGLKIIELLKI